jgi:hypothetical protein
MICPAASATESDRDTRAASPLGVPGGGPGRARGRDHGARRLVVARPAGGLAGERPAFMVDVPHQSGPSGARRPRPHRVQRVPLDRARGIQQPKDRRMWHVPREGGRGPAQGWARRGGDDLHDVPRLQAGRSSPDVHRLPREATWSGVGGRGARHDGLREMPPRARVALDRARRLRGVPRRARDGACRPRRLQGLRRLPPRPRARDGGARPLFDMPRAARRSAPRGARLLRRMPPPARLRGRRRAGVHRLPRREGDAGDRRGPGALHLHELPYPARSGERGVVLRCVPREDAGRSRESRRLHHLPRAARAGAATRGPRVQQLPPARGCIRNRSARGRHHVRHVSQAAWFQRPRSEDDLPELSCTRDRPRRLEPRTPGLPDVPRRRAGAHARPFAAVRKLPRRRASDGTGWTSTLRGLPRSARRQADPRMRVLPPEQDRRSAPIRQRRLRDLPPAARARRDRDDALVRDVPRANLASRAPRGARPRRLRGVPRLVPRSATRRSLHVHRGELPRRSTQPSAASPGLQRMSRLPPVTRDLSARIR